MIKKYIYSKYNIELREFHNNMTNILVSINIYWVYCNINKMFKRITVLKNTVNFALSHMGIFLKKISPSLSHTIFDRLPSHIMPMSLSPSPKTYHLLTHAAASVQLLPSHDHPYHPNPSTPINSSTFAIETHAQTPHLPENTP